MKEFILDGNKFNDIEGFYNEIDKLLTKDLDYEHIRFMQENSRKIFFA